MLTHDKSKEDGKMKSAKTLVVLLAFLLVCVSPVCAEDYTDLAAEGNVGSFSAIEFKGPYVIDYIDRVSSSQLKAYFTNGVTYTATIGERQRALGLALVDNLYLYLYVDGSSVYGIVLATN